jgi:hypothetical protein
MCGGTDTYKYIMICGSQMGRVYEWVYLEYVMTNYLLTKRYIPGAHRSQ